MLNPRLPSLGAWSTALRTYLPSGERTLHAARDQRPVRYARALHSDAQTQWQSLQLRTTPRGQEQRHVIKYTLVCQRGKQNG